MPDTNVVPLARITRYRVTFERIGRHYDVPPLDTAARDADHLADRVLDYARPRLFSGGVSVTVDLERMSGRIRVGQVRPAGTFTIEVAEPVGTAHG